MKNVSVLTAIAFSVFFFACEEETIPVPLPPPSQTTVNEPAPAPVEQKVEAPVVAEKPSEPVKVTKTPPPAKEPARTITYYGSDDMEQLSKGRYIIQVGIFPTEASAKKLIKKLANDGIKAYNAKVENPDPDKGMFGTYNRVRIGFFDVKSSAEAFAKARLEPLGYAWWVDKSKNDNIGKLVNYGSELAPEPKQQAPRQMSEQEKREAERAAAIAAAKEEYKAIAKAANAAAKATPPPSKTPAPAKAPAPAKTKAKKKETTKEAEIDSRGRVKMKSRRSDS